MAKTTNPNRATPRRQLRNTRRMRRLRNSLPLIAGLIILAVVFWPSREEPDPFTLSNVEKEIEPEVLRMINPNYSGTTADGETFSVRADAARQSTTDPARIELDLIEASYTSKGMGDISIRASGGAFHTVQETLALTGRIALHSSRGYQFNAGALFVKFDEGTATSSAPVVADAPFGHITAAGFDIVESGNRLTFRGPVHMKINRGAISGNTVKDQ